MRAGGRPRQLSSGFALGQLVTPFEVEPPDRELLPTAAVAVGNALGSMVFFVTANAGILALLRPLTLAPSMWNFHIPF